MKKALVILLFLLALLAAGWLSYQQLVEPKEGPLPRSFMLPNLPSDMQNYRTLVVRTVQRGERIAPLFSKRYSSSAFLKLIPIRPADTVADIGCGTGVFEIALLEENIPFQQLYAVEIDAQALDYLGFLLDTTRYAGREKIKLVRSTLSDVSLPAASIDVMVVNNVYTFNSKPGQDGNPTIDPTARQCLTSMWQALRPDGRCYVFYTSAWNQPEDVFSLMSHSFTAAGFREIKRKFRLNLFWSKHQKEYMIVFGKGENGATKQKL